MKNICIIPARGGSKRIPKKNIKNFLGKPIIAYAIEQAIKSQLFDEIIVSTDFDEIAAIAKNYGAKVPFLRQENTANDYATIADVLAEALAYYQNQNISFENLCCIYATAPFVTPSKLKAGYELLISGNFNSVVSVIPFSFPVQRGVTLKENKLQFVYPQCINTRSQDLETIYHDAGQFFFIKCQSFLAQPSIWTDNTGGYVLSELEAQDIDTEIDWQLAELKYQLLRKQ